MLNYEISKKQTNTPNVEFVIYLFNRNANVECRTKKGFTPLFLTCKEGFKEIAVMLAKHGALTEVCS